MELKEFLSQATWINIMINTKLEQLEELKRLSMKVTSDLKADKISVAGREKSRMESIIVKMIDFENILNQDIDRYVDLRKEIEETINLTTDGNSRLVLQLRYIAGKPWDDIADTLGYDKRTVFRLHGKAIKEIESKWGSYKKSS